MISWGLVTISCGVVMVSWLFGNGKLRCGNGKLECGNGKLRCSYKGMGVW